MKENVQHNHKQDSENDKVQDTPTNHIASHTRETDEAHGTEGMREDHALHGESRHEAHDRNAVPSGKHEDHDGHHVDHVGHEDMFRVRFLWSLLLSIPVLLYSEAVQGWLNFSVPEFPGSEWVTPAFALIVFGYGGVPFLRMAIPELRNRRPGMMTLISLAISVALLYSVLVVISGSGEPFFWELVTLIVIMLLGHWLEMRSVRQASGALDELAKLMPDTAERILPDDSTETIHTSELREGDLVLIRPGASTPADGEVVEGNSDLNEAMITGESKPVKKAPGSGLIAGTINGDGSLRVRVTATGDKTALAGIMRLVEQAQMSKSRTQVLADRAAGWLFYGAIGVAVLTAVLWTIAVGFNADVVARVATVLVIACPHALGLAVPLVVAITTAMGANNGILVRDRLALEAARDIDIVVFDKTGTLTEGRFGVVGIASVEGIDQDKALALAAAVEGDSEHTIARGIRQAAKDRGLSLPHVEGFEAIKGRGVRAEIDGKLVHLGGPRLLELLELTLPPRLASFDAEAGAKGQTVTYLVEDGTVSAAFALADVIRPESKPAIEALQAMGVETAMLTGDSRAVAKAVASELGIKTYFAEVLPAHKDQKIVDLQVQGKRVAMVGDGVNDAPALTRADVGIAVGSGTDVAVESAGIVLVKNNPLDIVKIVLLSRASYRKMIQNLIWATGYNIVALPLAAGILAPIGILLSPAIGALFMSLSTVIVALNAQLLRRHELAEEPVGSLSPA
jgi:Cu2+-exporting ATPase